MPVSPASITDVPVLNSLVNSAYRGESSKKGWTTEAHLLDGIRIDDETLTKYFNTPGVSILKYMDESAELTGCVYLEKRGEKLYVGMFSVKPTLQNQGIGKLLLSAAETYAKELNCRCLTMTVISSRHELISWYERRGYHATGEILPFHEGTRFGVPRQLIELIVMEKHI
jgi:ribosomal protein S18 acetylase RimI-like enzyme